MRLAARRRTFGDRPGVVVELRHDAAYTRAVCALSVFGRSWHYWCVGLSFYSDPRVRSVAVHVGVATFELKAWRTTPERAALRRAA